MVTQNILRTFDGSQIFTENHFKFVTAVDKNKCLLQVKLPISLHTYISNYELPSNISTMVLYIEIPCTKITLHGAWIKARKLVQTRFKSIRLLFLENWAPKDFLGGGAGPWDLYEMVTQK